jgi:SAM-dependent methyltransferase
MQTIRWVPTQEHFLDEILDFIKPQKSDVFCDLGCGDARVLIHVAKNVGCKCIGIERQHRMFLKAQQAVDDNNLNHLIELRKQNIFKADLTGVTICFAYLYWWIDELVPILNKYQLRFISRNFSINYKTNNSPVRKILQPKRQNGRGFGFMSQNTLVEYITPILLLKE